MRFKEKDKEAILKETEQIKDYYLRAAFSNELYIGFKEEDFLKMSKNLENEFLTKYRNPELCSNSKPEFMGVDLTDIMLKIANDNYENFIVVIVDPENKKVFKWRAMPRGTITNASLETNKEMFKFLFENIDEIIQRELYVVTIHNHPFHVPAIVNKNDEINWEINFNMLFRGGVDRYGDDFIVTPYDVYSNRQNNKNIGFEIVSNFNNKIKKRD